MLLPAALREASRLPWSHQLRRLPVSRPGQPRDTHLPAERARHASHGRAQLPLHRDADHQLFKETHSWPGTIDCFWHRIAKLFEQVNSIQNQGDSDLLASRLNRLGIDTPRIFASLALRSRCSYSGMSSFIADLLGIGRSAINLPSIPNAYPETVCVANRTGHAGLSRVVRVDAIPFSSIRGQQ